jgi:hypothetical protein
MSDGFLERLGPGGIHLSMSTVLPETSKKLSAIHAQHGSAYVEAPIFGRPEAAVAHQLWIPVAGPEQAKEQARPLLQAMGGQGVFDFGEEAGAAVLVKFIGNLLIVSAGYSMREALSLEIVPITGRPGLSNFLFYLILHSHAQSNNTLLFITSLDIIAKRERIIYIALSESCRVIRCIIM